MQFGLALSDSGQFCRMVVGQQFMIRTLSIFLSISLVRLIARYASHTILYIRPVGMDQTEQNKLIKRFRFPFAFCMLSVSWHHSVLRFWSLITEICMPLWTFTCLHVSDCVSHMFAGTFLYGNLLFININYGGQWCNWRSPLAEVLRVSAVDVSAAN